MTEVVIDIESTGRTYKSVFAIALCVKYSKKKKTEAKVFYIPDSPNKRSPSTMKWWTSDPKRKKFLEDSLEHCKTINKKETIISLRNYIDEIYSNSESVTFYSDFPTFDLGMTDALLAEYNLLPVYLKDDSSPPSNVVNYVNYLRGHVSCDPSIGSSKTFRLAEIERPNRENNHNPLKDVKIIMREVQLVKNKIL